MTRTAAAEFLTLAGEFCTLVEADDLSSKEFLDRLCELLPRVYAAAVALPEELADDEFELPMTQQEWDELYGRLADRFGAANFYRFVYDQYDENQQEVVGSMLAADIGDIYRSLCEVLGDPRGEIAAGDWRMAFDISWGDQAARAMSPLNQLRRGWGYAPVL